MKCLHKTEIMRWVDGEFEKASGIEEHLRTCSACREAVSAAQKLRDLLKETGYSLVPSEEFESGFWQKVNASIKEPWYRKVLAEMDALIPRRALSPAWTVLLAAVLVGGSGGFFSGLYSGSQGRADISLRHITGYSDYKGLPASSVAAAYLQWMERKA